MASIEIFISASTLGSGIESMSFFHTDCGDTNNLLTSSSNSFINKFSRDEFLSGIYLNMPEDANNIFVRPINKECRTCKENPITLNS